MTYSERGTERWLLPDGVEDILPERAARIETLRRRLVDLYKRWGYELVIPPLLEYTDSLLIGMERDLDLMTFKVVDQLTGRTMGIRADITPQTARIDAHSLNRRGVSRLCYAGHVLHTKPKSPLATRSPIQAGVELYGESGIDADVEVISLLLASLQEAGLQALNIDLGHVGIYRALVQAAGLDAQQEQQLFDLLQGKAVTELSVWVAGNVQDQGMSQMLLALPQLAGGVEVLAQARQQLGGAPEALLMAIDELSAVAQAVAQRYPEAKLYFDLSELRGYHYHTGIVFAAFAEGLGTALANGGRYDHVGEAFGNARPASGFGVDLTAVEALLVQSQQDATKAAIFAAANNDAGQWPAINDLRAQGETVVCGFAGQSHSDMTITCDRELVLEADEYRVKAL